MKNTITYDEAKALFDKYLKTQYLRFHSRESEMIMRHLARHFGEDEEFWGITGLLHDLDMDICNGDYTNHGKNTIKILRDEGYEIPKMFQAILGHVEGIEGSDTKRESTFDYILAAAENITGIITAYVLMKPDKKVAGTKVKSIKKKLKDKRFAASVNREFIAGISEKTDLEAGDFIQIAIDAMTEIADETGM